MLKKLSLAKKLYLGFGTILVLFTILGVVIFNNLVNIKEKSHDSIDYSRYSAFALQVEIDHYKWLVKLTDLFLHNEKKVHVELDHTKCELGKFLYGKGAKELSAKDPVFKELLNKLKDPHKKLHESAQHIDKIWKQRHLGLRNLLKDQMNDQHQWVAKLSKIVIERNAGIKIQTDPAQSSFGKFLRSSKLQEYIQSSAKLGSIIERIQAPYILLYGSAQNIVKVIKNREYDKARKIYSDTTLPAMISVEKMIHEVINLETVIINAQSKSDEIFKDETLVDLELSQTELSKIRTYLSEKTHDAQVVLDSTVDRSEMIVSVFTILAILLGACISIFLAISISRSIFNVVTNLQTGSEQVASASSQVAQSSQSMAEGASEQASSLEQISSSLEEMSSTTKQNADNIGQVNSMARDAQNAAEKGTNSMQKMSDAIGQIQTSSNETAKIIKTIDEIAFQTNLLALNAAVEAARAGEAGKGFAVVAEEVRNLAQRSADAAKNTSRLIEDAQTNSQNGVNMTKEVDEGLKLIVDVVQKVSGLVEEVSIVTTEQTQGMEQINVAISQIDIVTQSNAASAEESASASEELSGQATELQDMVASLVEVVQGVSEKSEAGFNKKRDNWNNVSHLPVKKNNLSNATNEGQVVHKIAVNAGIVHDRKPEEIIPLDDSELKKF